MKIKQIQIVVFCIFTQITYAQKTQTMAKDENLKGNVKTVYVTNGSNFVKKYFDETGNIIRKEDKISGYPVYINDRYVYDSEGRLITYVIYSEDKPDDIMMFACDYNAKGLLVEFRRYPGSTLSYYDDYDENGNCILERIDGMTISIQRIYNDKKQVVEEITRYMGGETRRLYLLDGTERESITEPYEMSRVLYEYNELGDISRMTEISNENTVTVNITYKYDDKGNWVERTQSEGNISRNQYSIVYERALNDTRHLTRTIEYYE